MDSTIVRIRCCVRECREYVCFSFLMVLLLLLLLFIIRFAMSFVRETYSFWFPRGEHGRNTQLGLPTIGMFACACRYVRIISFRARGEAWRCCLPFFLSFFLSSPYFTLAWSAERWPVPFDPYRSHAVAQKYLKQSTAFTAFMTVSLEQVLSFVLSSGKLYSLSMFCKND